MKKWEHRRAGGWQVAAMAAVILLISSGCASSQTATGKKHSIALVTKSTTSAFWHSVKAGAGAAAAEYNLDFTFEGPEKEEDYETQNRMIREAVERGAEALVISAVDYNANAEAVDQAAKKGLQIVVIDSDVNSSGVVSRIGTNNDAAGEMAARAMLDGEEEVLHVGIVNYDVNSANGQQREEGFRRVIQESPRVADITTINVISTTEDARIGTEKLLKEHPEINAIVTFNEWTSLGVGWAIRGQGLADATRVVAFDSNVVNVGMLETGEVDALIVQNPYAMGYLGVEAAYRLLNGQKVTAVTDTDTVVVTRENMYDEACQRILFTFEE
jgi:ribose transport system substrate-binding protein